MRKWHESGPFTVFDTETTGLSPRYDRIIEIAAIKVLPDGSRENYHSLVNPQRRIPLDASRVNNITDEMVRSAPEFSELGPKFLHFCSGSTLVAHNAMFDLGFLQESLSRSGLKLWNGKTIDSIKIVKNAYPGLPSYSLQSLKCRFNLGTGLQGTAHRAFADVEWTLEIFGMALQAIIDSRAN
ncbi:MAG: 3'-5' exonuclease [Victivallales bacterium]|nr:3'-5' exonuclease [Victivallales bacterium]